VPPPGKAVVNADQTVIIVWDAASKTEHFIRQASFKSDAEDFGFLVPTPSQPELEEAGNDAFPLLAKLTAPAKRKMPRPPRGGIGCSDDVETKTSQAVHVRPKNSWPVCTPLCWRRNPPTLWCNG
jgi:hypothetical protein